MTIQEISKTHLITGTNAERLAFDITLLSDGKRWIETDTGYEYVKYDGAWHTPPVGGGGPHTHPESDVVNLVTDLSGKAPSAQGVTNGNTHDHHLGDGADIDHPNLSGVTATQHHTNTNDPSSGEKAALAGTSGTPGTLNKYVTDGDARNTNNRNPNAHNHVESEVTGLVTDLAGKEPANANIQAHISAAAPHTGHVQIGGQLGGTAASPDVRGIRESGATLLTLGAIADGEFLKRSGTNIVSSAISGSGLTQPQVLARVSMRG